MRIPFILIALAAFCFGFQSKYLPRYEITGVDCDEILHKTAFDVCYSCAGKIPRLAVYRIDGKKAEGRSLSRKGLRFRPDYSLPARCRSYSRDYAKTGFDRGHLVPNAAFDYDRKLQKETFLMSNAAPQKPGLNRRPWAAIERFARRIALKYGKISVITGTCGASGRVRRGVAVPKYWYKIIFPPSKKPIAFLAENTKESGRKRAREFLTLLEKIERTCGLSITHK